MKLNIKNISLDQVMVNTLNILKPDIDLSKFNVIYDKNILGTRLERMDNINEKSLNIPIKIKKGTYIPPHFRDCNNEKYYYRVIDGRHRVVYSIINCFDIIEAELV